MSDSSKHIVEFALVYNQYKTHLFNYTLKMLNDRMTCEDIVQNVFIKFFENMERIRNAGSIRFWLFTTARNEIFTFYRNKKIHVDQFGAADSDELEIESSIKVDEELEMKETSEIILNALNTLPVDQRDVFLLKEYGGFSYKEISAMLNIDEELVKSRLFKTRKKLILKLSRIYTNKEIL